MPTLQVRLISARSLLAADTNGKSDPYGVLKIGHTVHKSRVIQANLNPTWNETFTFQVGNPQMEQLMLEIFDKDAIGKDDSLGVASVPLTGLRRGQELQVSAKLKGGEAGESVGGLMGQGMGLFNGLMGKKTAAPPKQVINNGEVQLALTAVDFDSVAGPPGGAPGGWGAPPPGGAPGGWGGAPPGYPPPGGAPGGWGAPPGYPPPGGAPGGWGAPPGYPPPGGAPPGPGGWGAPPPGPGGYGSAFPPGGPPPGGAPGGWGAPPPGPGGYPPPGGAPPGPGGWGAPPPGGPPPGGAPGGWGAPPPGPGGYPPPGGAPAPGGWGAPPPGGPGGYPPPGGAPAPGGWGGPPPA